MTTKEEQVEQNPVTHRDILAENDREKREEMKRQLQAEADAAQARWDAFQHHLEHLVHDLAGLYRTAYSQAHRAAELRRYVALSTPTTRPGGLVQPPTDPGIDPGVPAELAAWLAKHDSDCRFHHNTEPGCPRHSYRELVLNSEWADTAGQSDSDHHATLSALWAELESENV